MAEARRRLSIGIVTDGLEERATSGRVEIANGGVGVYIYNLVKSLCELDEKNHYTLIRCGEGGLDIYGARRIRSIALPRTRLQRYSRWLDLPYRRVARELGLDLIHYPNQFGGVGLQRSVRRVVTLHDLTPLYFPHFHPWQTVVGYRLLLRPALSAADHVIVDSEATRAEVIAHGLARPERLTAIPLGVAPIFRPGIRSDAVVARYDLPDRFVLTVGVLEPRKNLGVLLEALRMLHAEGERVPLVAVGRDGWRCSDPLADPVNAEIRPWVKILRNVPELDLAEIYARATVFAYPSLHEGFGLPVVEAMACGLPVVTSRASSLPEVAGDAAALADPHDPRSFATELGALLRDPERCRRLAVKGVRRAGALSWRRTAERTLEVYERVCTGAGAGGAGR